MEFSRWRHLPTEEAIESEAATRVALEPTEHASMEIGGRLRTTR